MDKAQFKPLSSDFFPLWHWKLNGLYNMESENCFFAKYVKLKFFDKLVKAFMKCALKGIISFNENKYIYKYMTTLSEKL